MTMYFASEPALIGAHEWRFVVQDSRSGTGRVTAAQWRRCGAAEAWRSDREWPKYDSDNGVTMGLPRGLAKVYARHQRQIDALLEGRNAREP